MPNPTETVDVDDPGDDTQRRFRYQHAYGLILIAGSVLRDLDYAAIWCEQQEDILGEIEANLFDAFQIKSRKEHRGLWKLSEEPLYNAIAKFTELEKIFTSQFRNYAFVSNVDCLDSDTDQHRDNSLPLLMRVLKDKPSSEWAIKRHNDLAVQVGCTSELLVRTIKKLKIIKGPGLDSFDSELCQLHLSRVPECLNFNAAKLAEIRDTNIYRIFRASSLGVDSPTQHYAGLTAGSRLNPLLQEKRLSSDGLKISIQESIVGQSRYPSSLRSLQIGAASERMPVLAQKMSRGGILDFYESMRRRALSAEQRILGELGTPGTDPEQLIADLESLVLTQCEDAHLRAKQQPAPYGEKMLIDVQDRLVALSKEPARVYRFDSDALIGIAGLLSSECKVWWSDRFVPVSE
jgi:hypothetical protein